MSVARPKRGVGLLGLWLRGVACLSVISLVVSVLASLGVLHQPRSSLHNPSRSLHVPTHGLYDLSRSLHDPTHSRPLLSHAGVLPSPVTSPASIEEEASITVKKEFVTVGAASYAVFPLPSAYEETHLAHHPVRDLQVILTKEQQVQVGAALDTMLALMHTPSAACHRMVRQGGKSCRRLPDGDKKVCLDQPFGPPSAHTCLIYGFGVGDDLSFDRAMGEFGCHVFAFDDDPALEAMERQVAPRVSFLHVRVGSEDSVLVYGDREVPGFQYLQRPLLSIIYLLGHLRVNIDILKIDIDGPEFEVLENSVFKSHILEHTRQLCLEVHLSHLRQPDPDSGASLVHIIHNYTRVFQGLEERGLRLAYYEPNYFKPDVVRLAGRKFSVFGEQVWVNTRLQQGTGKFRLPSQQQLDEVELTQ